MQYSLHEEKKTVTQYENTVVLKRLKHFKVKAAAAMQT